MTSLAGGRRSVGLPHFACEPWLHVVVGNLKRGTERKLLSPRGNLADERVENALFKFACGMLHIFSSTKKRGSSLDKSAILRFLLCASEIPFGYMLHSNKALYRISLPGHDRQWLNLQQRVSMTWKFLSAKKLVDLVCDTASVYLPAITVCCCCCQTQIFYFYLMLQSSSNS